MDNVVVQGGEVAVSSMIKAAMPDLHPGSILRSARTAMKDFEGPGLAQKMVKGRMTTMASLDVCNYIMDNLPGSRWVAWRNAQGESFKASLSERVQAEKAPEEVPVEEAEEQEEEEVQETKESTMKKALRTLDINGSVRIDEASGKASIIDVIKLLSPGATSDYAKTALSRVVARDSEREIERDHADPLSVPIAGRVSHIKINGVGHVTPVSDAKTIVEIIWLLPASAAKSFRRQSAEVICRVMGGDVSLCGEIEERCARLGSTPSGRSYQEFMMGGKDDQEPKAKRTRIGPEIMELASEEDYAKYIKLGLKSEMVKTELSLVMDLKDAFEQITPLQARHKIELCDRISDIQRRAFRAVDAPAITNSAITNSPVMVTASPVTSEQPRILQDPGHDIPTPQCSPEVRGEEVSIAMIATEMGVSVSGRGGLIGKKLKALYSERYGVNAANELPKRSVIYGGRPYLENTYFRRDKDLVERAVRMIVG